MRIPSSMICMVLTALVGLTAVGCQARYVLGNNGAVPDAGAGSGGTPGIPGAGGGAGTIDGGSPATPPSIDAAPTPESAGTLGLQHLTVPELTNTMVDLLGVSPATVSAALSGAGLPNDDVSDTGFVAPSIFSPLQIQALLSIAEQLASVPSGSLPSTCASSPAGAQATACATTFINAFGRRAFRRPVTDQEAAALLDLFNTATGFGFDFQGALTQVVRGMLQSPHFLYHWEVGDTTPPRAGSLIALTAYQIASRLSYLLWQTMPDETLLTAADNDQLSTPTQILTQANRMLGDPRAQAGLANFHRQWLRLDDLDLLQKDPTLYPTFNQIEATALGTELATFVTSVVLPGGDGTLRTLLTAAYTYQDDPDAAGIYGAALGPPGGVLPLNPAQRAGVLTQIAFLATNATPTLSDPLRRGAAVWQQLLCGSPTGSHPPFTLGTIDMTATRRDQYAQLYAQQASPAACATCHSTFDSLGFAFENYDAIGAYQTVDNGHAIDPSGVTLTPGGSSISFQSAVELVNALAASDEVKWCVTRQWFRFVLGRAEVASDQGSMELAYRAASEVSGFSIRQMIISLVQTQTFRFRAPSPGEM